MLEKLVYLAGQGPFGVGLVDPPGRSPAKGADTQYESNTKRSESRSNTEEDERRREEAQRRWREEYRGEEIQEARERNRR